jgi:hypothetical protein
MRTATISLCLPLCVLCIGCAHRFTGTFEFTNNSTTRLWVQVSGFKPWDEPPVGVLVPGGTKGANMWPMRLPPQVTISWSEGDKKWTTAAEQIHTNISLLDLPRFPGKGRLEFEFTPERAWTLKYEPR